MTDPWQGAGWPVVRLAEIADLVSGGTPSRARPEFFSGDIPWLTGQDIPEGEVADIEKGRECVGPEGVRNSATRVVPAGTVLMTTRVSVGKTAVASRPLCFSQDVTGISIRMPGLLDPHFLAYYLLSQKVKFLQRNQGSTIVGITRDNLALERIPLPLLTEQRRIVQVLREAEAIRSLRQVSRIAMSSIFPALFDELFGDLLCHPNKYTPTLLGELLEDIQTGWSPSAEARPARSDEWGVLKLGAVTFGRYVDEEHKALPPNLVPRPAIEVKAGDLLLTRKNTKELVGAAAFVWETRPRLMFSDLIFRLKLKPDSPVHPKWLWALFSHPSFRPKLSQLADGAAGSMPNIPKSRLSKLRVPIPRPEQHQRFIALLDELYGVTAPLARELAAAEALTLSLKAAAFSGELTRQWREMREYTGLI